MRSIRRASLLLVGFSLSAFSASAAEDPWRDSTRDVYIDARLDRSAQVLVRSATHEAAVVIPELPDAFVLDRDAGTVRAISREAFVFEANRATARLAGEATSGPAGRLEKLAEGGSLFFSAGHTILVSRHQGLVGEIPEERLWATVPVWKSLMESYRPSAETVAAYRKLDRRATLTVVFGTWCGDSKDFVPKLIKTLKMVNNINIVWRLVALDNQFLEPHEIIQGRRIINVPTVIVESGGREIGRIVETPAAATMEEGVLSLLRGEPSEHQGRWERGPELARGAYLYREAGVQRGREDWILYETKGGGRLLHSRVTDGDLSTEVFQGTDASGRLDFAEITKRQGEGIQRARFFVDGHTLTARLRGREAGILEQNLVLPESFGFASPAVAAAGWVSAHPPAQGRSSDLVCYVAPAGFGEPLGETCTVTFRSAGGESVRVPAGQFETVHLARQAGVEFSDWWVDRDLGIPVRGVVNGSLEYELASLEVAASAREKAF